MKAKLWKKLQGKQDFHLQTMGKLDELQICDYICETCKRMENTGILEKLQLHKDTEEVHLQKAM